MDDHVRSQTILLLIPAQTPSASGAWSREFHLLMPSYTIQGGYNDQEHAVGTVAGQAHRDLAIYRQWIDGANQTELAGQYGVTQPAISLAIGRVLDGLPEPEKAAEIRRTLALVDDLMTVYVPRARAGNTAANREVRGLLALRGKYLGVDRREVSIEHTGVVEHVSRGPTVAEVLAQVLERQGRPVPGELTRLDS